MTIKLQEEYGADLAVLFVEVQGTPALKAESFALHKKWLGGASMWTTERPFNLDLKGIPQCALLSPSGEILLAGYTGDIHSKVEDKIKELVKAKHKAPAGVPAAVGKAAVEFNNGNYGAALAAVEQLTQAPDAAMADAAAEMKTSLRARLDRMVARADWLGTNGYFEPADALVAELAEGVKDDAELSKSVGDLKSKLEADDRKVEREAAKALAAYEKKLYAKGPDKNSAKVLKDLAAKYPGTKTAERAAHLAAVATDAR